MIHAYFSYLKQQLKCQRKTYNSIILQNKYLDVNFTVLYLKRTVELSVISLLVIGKVPKIDCSTTSWN
jgi:hypothetical protein